MPTQTQIRDEVTSRIIQALESSLLPWRRPWSGGSTQPGRHSNVATKRPYQGVNGILLELHAQQHCLFSRWWGTFPMWKSLGCNIRKRPQNVQEGHWGCRIVFYKPVTKTIVDAQTGDEEDERFFVMTPIFLRARMATFQPATVVGSVVGASDTQFVVLEPAHRCQAVVETLRSREKEFSWQTNNGLPAWNPIIRNP